MLDFAMPRATPQNAHRASKRQYAASLLRSSQLMIRKILYLFLGVFLLATIIVGGGFGLFLFQVQSLFKQVKVLKLEYERTNVDFPALADYDELTTDTFRRFMQIRAVAGEKLSREYDGIDQRMRQKDSKLESEGPDAKLGIGELMQIIRSEFPRLTSVGEFHLEKLQEARLSADQYKVMTHHLMIVVAQAAERLRATEEEREMNLEPLQPPTDTEVAMAEAWKAYETPAIKMVQFSKAGRGAIQAPTKQSAETKDLFLKLAADNNSTSETENLRQQLATSMLGDLVETLAEDVTTTKTTAAIERHLNDYLRDGGTLHPNDGAPFLDLLIERFDPGAMAEK